MITLRTITAPAVEMQITEDQLTEACINATGGGWTEEQTAEAMALQSQVYRGEGPVEFTHKGNKFSLEYTA